MQFNKDYVDFITEYRFPVYVQLGETNIKVTRDSFCDKWRISSDNLLYFSRKHKRFRLIYGKHGDDVLFDREEAIELAYKIMQEGIPKMTLGLMPLPTLPE